MSEKRTTTVQNGEEILLVIDGDKHLHIASGWEQVCNEQDELAALHAEMKQKAERVGAIRTLFWQELQALIKKETEVFYDNVGVRLDGEGKLVAVKPAGSHENGCGCVLCMLTGGS